MRGVAVLLVALLCVPSASAFLPGSIGLLASKSGPTRCGAVHGQTFRIVAPHVLRDPALPRLPQSARRGRGVLALRAQVEEVFVGDVVEYPLPEGGKTVGLVEEIADDFLQIIPLVRREGVGDECYLDETQPIAEVSRSQARFVNVYPSQRVAWSTASPHHNPHGEESEDCYFIEDELSPSCTIPVKYITDT